MIHTNYNFPIDFEHEEEFEKESEEISYRFKHNEASDLDEEC